METHPVTTYVVHKREVGPIADDSNPLRAAWGFVFGATISLLIWAIIVAGTCYLAS